MPTVAQLLKDAYANWNDAAVLTRAGCELHDHNRLEFAQEVLERAIALDPKQTEAWAHLGYCHLRSSRTEKGCEVLKQGIAATDADKLRSTLLGFSADEAENEALKKQLEETTDPAARAELENHRFWQGDDDALGTIRKIVRDHPADEKAREVFLWTLMGARNRGRIEKLDLREEAVPLADQIIAAHPDRVMGHWLKVQMLSAEQDWDGVLAATSDALEHIPDEETMTHLRGRAFKEKGDLDRAAACFSRAIGMKPSFAGARSELGKTYEAQGKPELAEEIFRETLVANPGYAGGPVSLAMFFARQGRFEEAETLFLDAWPKLPEWIKQAVRQSPDAKPLLERDAIKAVLEPGA